MSQANAESHADVAVVIALKEEFRIFVAQARARARKYAAIPNPHFGGHDFLFEIPSSGGGHHVVVAALIDDMGLGPAGDVTHRVLSTWAPRVVANIGIAASLNPSDVRLGDVVVADQGNAYLAKSKARGDADSWEIDLGGDSFRSPEHIVRAVSEFEFSHVAEYEQWQRGAAVRLADSMDDANRRALIEAHQLREHPMIVRAHLASGPMVSAATAFGRWLRERGDRNAKALEMEAAGVMRAVSSRFTDADVLVLRGISDLGGADKSVLDKLGDGVLRSYAMHNATEALLLLLEAELLPRHQSLSLSTSARTGGDNVRQTERGGRAKRSRTAARATTRRELLDSCPQVVADFFAELIDDALGREHSIYWGTKGFTIRVAWQEMLIALFYGFPPGSQGQDKAELHAYLPKELPDDLRSWAWKLYEDAAPFRRGGQYTLKLTLDEGTMEAARRSIEILWQVVDRLLGSDGRE
jgi:nucleoside phosphorylase